MEKKEKILIIVGIIAVLLVIGILIMAKFIIDDNTVNNPIDEGGEVVEPKIEEFVRVEEDGSKTNISNEIQNTTAIINNVGFSNIKITEVTNRTWIEIRMDNLSTERIADFGIIIKLFDKDGKELVQIPATTPALEANQKETLNVSTTLDFANAYKVTIEAE